MISLKTGQWPDIF